MMKMVMSLMVEVSNIKGMEIENLKEVKNELSNYLDSIDVKSVGVMEIDLLKYLEKVEKSIIKEIDSRVKKENGGNSRISKKEIIMNMWYSGKSVGEISKELGILYNMVRNYIINYDEEGYNNRKKIKN